MRFSFWQSFNSSKLFHARRVKFLEHEDIIEFLMDRSTDFFLDLTIFPKTSIQITGHFRLTIQGCFVLLNCRAKNGRPHTVLCLCLT